MKILALSGSNADKSFNQTLLKFMTNHFSDRYDFELVTVKRLPMYQEELAASAEVLALAKQIEAADLVLIGTPEQQHSVTSALKSALEWLSSVTHPFNGKAIAMVSTSVLPQGAARSQTRLKTILMSPGFGAHVFAGDEFMLPSAPAAFDDQGQLKDASTIKFLDYFFDEIDTWYQQLTK
ncbi:MAG: NADPH-dependent FMN reductase [Lactobacillus sp.]